MGRVMWFAIGAVVGAGLAAYYFKTHALELTAGGIAEKLGASPGTVASVKDIAGAVQRLGN